MGTDTKSKMADVFRNQQVVKNSELTAVFGSRSSVSRLVKDKEIIPIGSGYYGEVGSCPILNKIAVLSCYYPQAVLVGHNALWAMGLLKNPIEDIEVQIENSTSLKNTLFKVQRAKKNRMTGIQQIECHGLNITTYPLEKILSLYAASNAHNLDSILEELEESGIPIDLAQVDMYDIDLQGNAVEKILTRKNAKKGESTPVKKEPLSFDDLVAKGTELFIESGLHSTSLKRVAIRLDVDITNLTRYFKSISDLKQAICDSRVKEIEKTVYEWEIPEEVLKMPAVEQLKFFIQGSFAKIDRHQGLDEFKFQAWAIAENHKSVHHIVRTTCGPAVEFIKDTLVNSVDGITRKEAEGRAVFLVSSVDGYNYLRSLYVHALPYESSKADLLESTKKTILELVIPSLLKP